MSAASSARRNHRSQRRRGFRTTGVPPLMAALLAGGRTCLPPGERTPVTEPRRAVRHSTFLASKPPIEKVESDEVTSPGRRNLSTTSSVFQRAWVRRYERAS